MIIANPLYDVVFKYLLEDTEIAKEILSTIQVRGLPTETKTKLERILQIFNPKFYTKDNHKLDFTGEADDPLVQKMLNRLLRAIADDELRRKMDLEDEVERILARESQKASAEKDKIIAEKDQVIAEKDKELEALRLLVAQIKQQKNE